MTKKPRRPILRWSDEEEVFHYVERELESERLEREREFMLLRWDTFPGIPAEEIVRGMEREAIEAARHRNKKPLQQLVSPDHPFNRSPIGGKPIRDQLSDEAWRLLSAPRGSGRPRMTPDQRRASNPVHDAAALVPVISDILRSAFPDQRNFHDRACAYAERLLGVKSRSDEGSNVRSYMHVSRKHRRKLSPA
jgi:hypothetical protein